MSQLRLSLIRICARSKSLICGLDALTLHTDVGGLYYCVIQYDRIRIFMRYDIVINLIFYSQDVKNFGFGHHARQPKQNNVY